MKNNYVKIGMIIITVVVVALGVYEVFNSIRYDKNGNAKYNTTTDMNRLISDIHDNELRKDQINFFENYSIMINNL